MEKIEEIYQGFKTCCERIKAGRFIMSNNRITQLLRYIASYPEIVDFVSECNKMFDYKQEYITATGYLGNGKIFKMPENHYKIVVLVTGLLYEIDRQSKDVLQFLKEFFDKGDVDKSFGAFCNEVVEPYCRAFEDMVFNKPMSLDDREEDENKSKQLSDSITEQLLPYMVSLSSIVVGDENISDGKRTDLLDMLEGMCYAIEKGNAKLLKYMWVGLKNTYGQYRMANSLLGGVKAVLTTFGVIDKQ